MEPGTVRLHPLVEELENQRQGQRAVHAAQRSGRPRREHYEKPTSIRKRKAADYQAQRRSIFELYIEEVANAIARIKGRKPGPIRREFLQVAHRVTAAEMMEEEDAMAEPGASQEKPRPRKRARTRGK